MKNIEHWKDYATIAANIAIALYFLIAAYGRYRTMTGR